MPDPLELLATRSRPSQWLRLDLNVSPAPLGKGTHGPLGMTILFIDSETSFWRKLRAYMSAGPSWFERDVISSHITVYFRPRVKGLYSLNSACSVSQNEYQRES